MPSPRTIQRIRESVEYTESQRQDLRGPGRRGPIRRGGKPGLILAKVTAMRTVSGGAWTDYPTNTAYLSYIEAHTVTDDTGAGEDTTTTHYYAMNSKTDAPNGLITAVGQIIGIIPYSGVSTTRGTQKMEGQAVLGLGCWLDYVRARS